MAVSRREERQQFGDATLYQVDARRFQRLEKSARQADRDYILAPGPPATARQKTNGPRLGERPRIEIRLQRIRGLFITAELAAVDNPVPRAVLQGNAPLPPAGVSGRTRVGDRVLNALAGDGQGTIARQPM